jgi:phosphoenolpyruvate-protein phosphotransferase
VKRIHGVAASAGVARGPWVVVDRPAPVAGAAIGEAAVEAEPARLRTATDAAASELRELAASVSAAGHPDEAEIFEAQAAIAEDPALATAADTQIGDRHVDAVGAILSAGQAFADELAALGDELLAARAADVLDVVDRIARRLAGRSAALPTLAEPAIVVAEDLPPSVTASLPRDRLLGLALEASSPTAHAAILARAYAIPAVVEAHGLVAALAGLAAEPSDEIAIDGASGEIVLRPDTATRADFDRRAAHASRRHEADLGEAELPATTLDGTSVTLLANVGSPAESAAAVALGAHGVGLFRTEFLFLERPGAPSEAEQLDAYRAVVEAFAPHPVTIRLLDVGGDKPIPYLPIGPEANPFLGVRALRLAPRERSLFVTQLRACYRAAAAGPVKVMAPMVADAGDADLLLELAEEARRGLDAGGLARGDVGLGVMLEIPSAILVADSYFGRLSFASLGTNDLLQYALAVDRGNPALERYRDSLHPAVLRLVADAVRAAGEAGIELSVCGEMAADPVAALALVGLGIRSLSMAASSLPAVRRAIRAATLTDLEATAREALTAASAADARARFSVLESAREAVTAS